MRRSIRNETPHSQDNPYWVSFSDLLSCLLILFILATLVLLTQLTQSQIQLDDSVKKLQTTSEQLRKVRYEVIQAIRELAKAEQVRREVLRDIKRDLNDMGIAVEVSDNESVLRIPSSVLAFESNQYEIPSNDAAKNTVLQIGKVLHRRLNENSRYQMLDTVFVEGHTDSRRSQREKGNWGLSTFRAISVWLWWEENLDMGQQLDSMKNHAGKPLFSVSGYAATRRIQEVEKTDDQLAQNRRIDIRFTSRKPAIENYTELQELLLSVEQ